MTDQEIRTAIAQACGWTLEQTNPKDGKCWHLNGIQSEEAPPDYHCDLNAMREAEHERLTDTAIQDRYLNQLYQIIVAPVEVEYGSVKWTEQSLRYVLIMATAPQRAKAFLRTLNLWREPEPAKS